VVVDIACGGSFLVLPPAVRGSLDTCSVIDYLAFTDRDDHHRGPATTNTSVAGGRGCVWLALVRTFVHAVG
jgi:hypothetical protein